MNVIKFVAKVTLEDMKVGLANRQHGVLQELIEAEARPEKKAPLDEVKVHRLRKIFAKGTHSIQFHHLCMKHGEHWIETPTTMSGWFVLLLDLPWMFIDGNMLDIMEQAKDNVELYFEDVKIDVSQLLKKA